MEKNNYRVQLGDEVRDRVTGLQGIAVARTTYLTGCDRIAVQPKIDKDGKIPESHYFDEPMLDVIKKIKVTKLPDVISPRPDVISPRPSDGGPAVFGETPLRGEKYGR